MKNKRKDSIILIIMLVFITIGICYFYEGMEDSKNMESTNLYKLVSPTSKAIITINRPLVFTKVILPKKGIGQAFSDHIDPIYQKIIQENSDLPIFMLSFHTLEPVFYTLMSEQKARLIFKGLDSFFPFKAERKTHKNIDYRYYPDTEKRFFGCYYHEGIFVASYSKKLLEQVVERQQKDSLHIIPELDLALKQANKNAPINLFVPSDSLDLHVQITEITEWAIKDKWLGADLFLSEDKLCCLHTQPYQPALDSLFYKAGLTSVSMWNNTQFRLETLYQCMSDTIESRINKLFPQIKTTAQVSHDEAVAFFTICGS